MPIADDRARALLDKHLEVPVAALTEVALKNAGPTTCCVGNPLAPPPWEIHAGVVVPEVRDRPLKRYDDFEVPVVSAGPEIALDDAARAGHARGDELPSLPRQVDVRVVVPEVPEVHRVARSLQRHDDFEVPVVSAGAEVALGDAARAGDARGDELRSCPYVRRFAVVTPPVGEIVA